MGILGVLTCEILELEFAHLLSRDSEVNVITVLEDSWSGGMIEGLKTKGAQDISRIPQMDLFNPGPSENLEVLVRVLELGLHNRKKSLQEGLVDAAKEMSRYADALFLGYGLCGNALEQPEKLLWEAGVPIFIPMDEGHPVDDCIGLLIGGRECYYGEQCKVAGTFFMIPGWSQHWKRMLDKEFGNMSLDMARRLLAHYERSLMILTPIMSEDEMRLSVEEFNDLFGLRAESCEGTLRILNETWKRAKTFLKSRTH